MEERQFLCQKKNLKSDVKGIITLLKITVNEPKRNRWKERGESGIDLIKNATPYKVALQACPPLKDNVMSTYP